MEWTHPIAGLLVGIVVGVTGVGGGALMTPILVMLLGVAPQTAIGTDLLFAAITKVFGTVVHQQRGTVDWLVVRRLAAGSVPAAALTLVWLQIDKGSRVHEGLLMQALALALAVTASSMLFKARLHALGRRLRTMHAVTFKAVQPGLTVAAGALLGVLVTLTSVGAGALGTVMLVYLYPLRLDARKLVGTDLAHAIPLTLVAGIGHWTLGNVDHALLGMLLLGSIPGVLLGALLSTRLPVLAIQRCIAVTLGAVAFKLLAG